MYLQFLCRNFLSRSLTLQSNPVWPLLEEVRLDTQSPTCIDRVGSFPLMSVFCSVEDVARFLPSHDTPLCYSYGFEALLARPSTDTESGMQLQTSTDVTRDFHRIFKDELESSMCLYTDGSKRSGALFTGFAILSPTVLKYTATGQRVFYHRIVLKQWLFF